MALEPVYIPGGSRPGEPGSSDGGGSGGAPPPAVRVAEPVRSVDSLSTLLVGASGSVTFPARPGRRQVERITVTLSTGTGDVRVYLSVPNVAQIVDGVDGVSFSVADMAQPIEWPSNLPLIVGVSNATAGADFSVTIQSAQWA